MRHARIKVTVTQPMFVAIELLAEREREAPARVAQRLLRSALDRTIHSTECQQRLEKLTAFQTREDWLSAQEDAAEELKMSQAEIKQ